MLKLFEISPKPTESDFLDFESEFKIKIPENLKMFLNKTNGGDVDEDCENPYNVNAFFSIGESFNYTISSARLHHIIWEKNLPPTVFPIGTTIASDFVSIIIDESIDHGKIRVDYMEDEEFAILANSLEELLGVENIEDFPNYYSE